MPVTLVAEPVTCLSDPPLRKRSSADSRKAVPQRLGCETERRLCKLIAEAAASTYAICQLVLVTVFLAAALVGVATSFAELSRLVERDAIRHTIEKAITPSY
jgi:hypothetical protein